MQRAYFNRPEGTQCKIEVPGVKPVGSLKRRGEGEALVGQRKIQKRPERPCGGKAVEHTYAAEDIACVYRDAEYERRERIERARKKNDGGILHAAAESERTRQRRPERAIALALHQHAVSRGQHQVACHHRDGVWKRCFYGASPSCFRVQRLHLTIPIDLIGMTGSNIQPPGGFVNRFTAQNKAFI